MTQLPISQKIKSKYNFIALLLPKIRGLVFLTKPFLRHASSAALIKFGNRTSELDMDLNQEYELSIFLSNKNELAVPFVVSKLSKEYALDTFVDIGANVGWVSRIVAEFGNFQKIYAFEPNHKAFKRLREHSDSTLEPLQLVISNKSGKFFETNKPSPFSGPSSFYYTEAKKKDGSNQILSTTLNEFLTNAGGFGDLIKIDVEGAELAVLQGGIGLALEKASFVIIEVGDETRLTRSTGGSVEEIYSLMTGAGYKYFYKVVSSENSIYPAGYGSFGDILFSKNELDLSLFTTWG